MLLDPHASQAYERPWCALTEIGGGAMYENCNIPTFELCVQEVIAGNRGFCIPNPRWQAPGPAARGPRGQRRRVDDRGTRSCSPAHQEQGGHIAGPRGCGLRPNAQR